MNLIQKCELLIAACDAGKLGPVEMPEDSSPTFSNNEAEERLAYFSLPMSLNYQRDSFALWRAALATYNDPDTRDVFSINAVKAMSTEELRRKLRKHKLALQPIKHTNTWQTISTTVVDHWGSFLGLIKASNTDFLILREIVQHKHKKGFPYLSGPKIFNYWSSILKRYAHITLSNAEHIELAVDTHVLKCSTLLGVITEEESSKLGRLAISEKWRAALSGSDIAPSDMHFVLWFWSRNGFIYTFK